MSSTTSTPGEPESSGSGLHEQQMPVLVHADPSRVIFADEAQGLRYSVFFVDDHAVVSFGQTVVTFGGLVGPKRADFIDLEGLQENRDRVVSRVTSLPVISVVDGDEALQGALDLAVMLVVRAVTLLHEQDVDSIRATVVRVGQTRRTADGSGEIAIMAVTPRGGSIKLGESSVSVMVVDSQGKPSMLSLYEVLQHYPVAFQPLDERRVA